MNGRGQPRDYIDVCALYNVAVSGYVCLDGGLIGSNKKQSFFHWRLHSDGYDSVVGAKSDPNATVGRRKDRPGLRRAEQAAPSSAEAPRDAGAREQRRRTTKVSRRERAGSRGR